MILNDVLDMSSEEGKSDDDDNSCVSISSSSLSSSPGTKTAKSGGRVLNMDQNNDGRKFGAKALHQGFMWGYSAKKTET